MEREHNLIPEDTLWKRFLYRIIYRSDTKLGKLFDIILLSLILASTAIIMMESVPKLDKRFHYTFLILEWVISIFFTVEYSMRIAVVKNKRSYIFSFFGIIDFLALVPFFLSFFFPITKYFLIFRMLRMLRIFRIFNLLDFMNDGYLIVRALKNSSRKIYIFLLFLIIFSVIVGSLMFMVEGGRQGFETIPQSIYWAVVTVTTVGYGDVSPITPLGKFFAVVLMLAGYSIIAVPTGIVTAEMRNKRQNLELICERCGNEDIDDDARYCKKCGKKLA
ncbi:voltage-gated potassium channel [Chryseobacterium bernardetii]|jgi:voltage-gated potassium channel|uniref:Voltage-gated potassium channel n=3 Tax=Chryseobacterium TaxID=59732 RepID=A0A543EGC6_9FLAO|nr:MULTISPECIES: ion transporter [Chryseobacterium]MDR6370668.1 voltage-gated potassium channel [Chryseobacterium vietnamense]MDR6441674.1 voltage-gated potassium channel [Chryseobacterium bernardetii]MDR6457117.1 voltage-gated potassium channel [Chryseobacterium vietnamense]MDR6485871.1 voltage-gated potassium channel [Chryseobacterium vietnamense]TQM20625.1 voltage-gated potassium channel [Chryseobacterium aquifrigidense]